MKAVRIKSDGTSAGTKIFVNGVQLKNVKGMRLEGDAEEGFLLHLTLYSLQNSIDIEVDGPMEIDEQRETLGTGTEAP